MLNPRVTKRLSIEIECTQGLDDSFAPEVARALIAHAAALQTEEDSVMPPYLPIDAAGSQQVTQNLRISWKLTSEHVAVVDAVIEAFEKARLDMLRRGGDA